MTIAKLALMLVCLISFATQPKEAPKEEPKVAKATPTLMRLFTSLRAQS